MAVYDLNKSGLSTLLSNTLSPLTQQGVVGALTRSGNFPGDKTYLPTEVFSAGATPASRDVVNHPIALYVATANQPLPTLASGYQNITFNAAAGSGGAVIGVGDGINFDDFDGGGDTLMLGAHSIAKTETGANTIHGGLSSDSANTLIGGAGADYLIVNIGSNVLRSGSGQNTLRGGAGNDTLFGRGQTHVLAGVGHNTLWGGLANPLSTAVPSDTLQGSTSAGASTKINLVLGNNTVLGGLGSETIKAGTGHDQIFLGAGSDTINLLSGGSTRVEETISGGRAVINVGLTGNDTIVGLTGKTTVVNSLHSSNDIRSQATVTIGGKSFTELTFNNGQTLDTTTGITIHFTNPV